MYILEQTKYETSVRVSSGRLATYDGEHGVSRQIVRTKKPYTNSSGTRNHMTGIHSRAHKLSLSVAGILVLVLLAGTAFVPRELRADAASRVASLAEDLDAALADTWHLAFPARRSDHAASTSHKEGAPQPAALLVLTGVDALPSGPAGADNDVNGFGTGAFIGSFNARSSAGSAPNSTFGLLNDFLRDDSSWAGTRPGFESIAGNFAGGGNAPPGFVGASGFAAGASAPAGGIAAGLSRAASPQGATLLQGRNVEGMPALTDANPIAHDAQADTHQRITALGTGFGAVSDAVGGAGNQVGSSGVLGGALSAEPGTAPATAGSSATPSDLSSAGPGNTPETVGTMSEQNDASHGGGAGNADPTTVDPVRQLLSGLDHPLQGENPQGSVSQNEVDYGATSGSGDGEVLSVNNPHDNDPHLEAPRSADRSIAPPGDSDPSFLANVPEPGSLALLSLGLGAVILWRRFLSRQ